MVFLAAEQYRLRQYYAPTIISCALENGTLLAGTL
jgi:hypothetical protein